MQIRQTHRREHMYEPTRRPTCVRLRALLLQNAPSHHVLSIAPLCGDPKPPVRPLTPTWRVAPHACRDPVSTDF